ncbi:MAG: anti-sigma factor antagonist [Coriobacteriia bacterium]|nr:anti-sigma factor antagonist [Coriobacteriia bacterium]
MITIDREPGSPACVARMSGDIDFAVVPDVRAAIDAAIGDGCSSVVMDLSAVTYADSSALGLLVWIDKRLQPYGGKLILAGADRNVSRVLELSGLVGVAPSVSAASSVEEALEGLDVTVEERVPVWTRHLDARAAVDGMAGLRTQVIDWVRPLGLSDSGQFDLKVAVGEALANAVRHGSSSDHDAIAVEVRAFDDRVEVLVSDKGHGFDGDAACDGDVYASGGRGVMFMRALMDKVEFSECTGGGTTVRLVKRLPATFGGAAEAV